LYIYILPFSMLHFPFQYTIIYSPPIVYPLFSRECWCNSDNNIISSDNKNIINSPDSLSSLIQDRKSRSPLQAYPWLTWNFFVKEALLIEYVHSCWFRISITGSYTYIITVFSLLTRQIDVLNFDFLSIVKTLG